MMGKSMKIKTVFLIQVLFFFFLPSINCTLIKNTPPDYIFLITLDTTRADHIDYSLKENSLTPHLAELASEGSYFSNAYSLIPITLPSHLSMFYSLPPHILKVYNNGEPNLCPLPSLEKILKNNGYATGAVISLGSVSRRWGIGKDFDSFIENFRKSYIWYKTAEQVNEDAFAFIKEFEKKKSFFWIHYSDPHEPYFPPYYKGNFSVSLNGEKIFVSDSIERALVKLELTLKPGKNTVTLETEIPEMLQKDKRLKINYHEFKDFSIIPEPETKDMEIIYPDEWKKSVFGKRIKFTTKKPHSVIELQNKSDHNMKVNLKFIQRMLPTVSSMKILYKQEVTYMDKHLGELIDYLKKNKMYKNSAFVIIGDHGEGLGEYRGHIGHIDYLNKIFVKVPLIIFGKNIKKSRGRKRVVSCLDIAPTILDIAQIKRPDFMKGNSLLRSLKKEKLLLETYAPEARGNAFSIIDFPYQIIIYPYRDKGKVELIDLEKDEQGLQNIINSPDVGSELKAGLLRMVQEKAEELANQRKKKPKLSEEDEEILRSLGYIK